MTTHNQNSRSGAESVEAEYEAKHDGSIEHVESASAVTSGGAGGVEGAYEFTPEQEKRVVRKMDRHIVPLLWTLYLLSVLDRSNVGNAKVAGMAADLKLSSDQYQWLLTIFYIAYVCFEFFPIMWKIVPPHIWAAIAVTSWGVVSTAQAATTNWTGMMICRFFLGMAEAAFGPGVPFFLSFFYHRYELGTRVGLFLSAAPLANCFAGALAYGITSGHTMLAPWRVLFLVEGIPTIVMGVVVFFFLPDSPATARFLNDDDKKIIAARQYRQVGNQAGNSRTGSINFREILETFADVKNLLPALMYFCTNVGFSSLPVFLPQILNDMGFSSINAQGLTAPPYFIAFLAVISSTYLADKLRQRGLVMITVSLTGATGYLILAICTSTAARYTGVFFAAIGVFSAIMNIIPWIINNQGSDAKRGAGVALLNLVGQCGPLLGTRVFPATDAPYYRTGMWVSASFLLFNAVLALTYRTILARANKKLDEKYPMVEGQATGNENDGPAFRYAV